MAKSKRVEFKTTDGITLRGDFYQAKGEAPNNALGKSFLLVATFKQNE